MTLLGFTNFETGDLSEAYSTVTSGPSPVVAASSTHVRSGSYALHCETTGGSGSPTAAYQLGMFSSGSLAALTYSASTQLYVRFWLYVNSLPSVPTDWAPIFAVIAGGSLSSADLSLQVQSSGDVRLMTGSTQVGSTTAAILTTGTWHEIQISFQTDTAGPYNVVVDGTSVISGSSQAFGTTSITAVWIGKSTDLAGGGVGIDLYYDDVAWASGGFPAESKGTVLVPTGATSSASWTGNYTNVDTVPPNTSSPLSDSTSGDASYFSITTLSAAGVTAGATINGVKVFGLAKGASASIVLAISVSVTDYFTSGLSPGSSYAPFGNLWTTNPTTGLPWAYSDINSATIGVGNNANTLADLAALYLLVDWSTGGSSPTTQPAAALLPLIGNF